MSCDCGGCKGGGKGKPRSFSQKMRSFKNIAMFAIVILLFVIVLGDKEWALPLAQILGKGIIGFFAANVGQKGIDAYREARENGKD